MFTIIFYIIMAAAFLLVTFFGLGPVLFADGRASERIATLLVVLFIYAVLVMIIGIFLRKRKSKARY